VLLEQKRQHDEQAAVVDDPPDVDGALQTLVLVGEGGESLGHQQAHVGRGGAVDGVCGREEA